MKKLKNQYVVMTLGANPLLSYFTNITFPVPFVRDVSGPCVSSTGYSEGWFFPDWYAGPISAPVGCLDQEWNSLDQTQHLVSIYEALLSQNDRVLVVGYYRACSWSFGNWQPTASLTGGPAAGHSCHSQSRPVSTSDSTKVTQWDQAEAVDAAVNSHIHDAVVQAQNWAKTKWSGTNRYQDLAWTTPDETAWADHQPGSPSGSWIFLNDTWIHPSQAGATQLAHTVTAAMCSDFGHWCGSPPRWG